MKGYDYSRDNLYFVTICVKDMLCCLGEIVANDEFNCSGTARNRTARELIVRDGNNHEEINLNAFSQIMILNAHGVIVQERLLWLEKQYPYMVIDSFVIMPNHVHAIIEIDSLISVCKGIKIKSLSSLVGAFKTTSSKLIHQTGFLDFAWKRSFHDHIIRTQNSYQYISNYIDENPQKWQQDSLFSEI